MIFSLTRSPPSVKQDRIHHPSVSSTYRATYSGENMAPSRSTPRMMQMTRAAFQAVVSQNEQATDPKSHTLVRITYTLSSPVLSPANSDGRPPVVAQGHLKRQPPASRAKSIRLAILHPKPG